MKKSILKKIIACAMALTMLSGTGMAVSAIEPKYGGITDEETASQFNKDEVEYVQRLGTFMSEMKGFEFFQNDEYYYMVNNDGTVSTFFYKGNEKNVTVPSEIDGKTVTTIAWSTFNGYSGLKSVVLPDTVTVLGGCFYNCRGLEKITISKNVIQIYNDTFKGCTSLKNIYVAKENSTYSSLDGVLTNKEENEIIMVPNGKEGSYTVPEQISSLRGFASFNGCEKLTEITLSDKIKVIPPYAFRDCTQLKKVNFPNTLTEIKWNIFEGCISLNQITIPENVSIIERNAFYGCGNLTIYGIKGSYAETYAKENNIPFVCEFTNTSTISTDNILFGKTVTVNASADGGNGNYTYAVLYKKNSDKKWTVKQNYSTNSIITIKPAKATDYQICVKVKDNKGNIVKKFFDLKVNAKLANTSVISSNIIKKGDTVTVKGSATGGNGNYTYAVLYKKKAETKWTVRQGYKDNDEITVRPYTNTDYDICIKVKDSDGTVSKKYFSVKVQ